MPTIEEINKTSKTGAVKLLAEAATDQEWLNMFMAILQEGLRRGLIMGLDYMYNQFFSRQAIIYLGPRIRKKKIDDKHSTLVLFNGEPINIEKETEPVR